MPKARFKHFSFMLFVVFDALNLLILMLHHLAQCLDLLLENLDFVAVFLRLFGYFQCLPNQFKKVLPH